MLEERLNYFSFHPIENITKLLLYIEGIKASNLKLQLKI